MNYLNPSQLLDFMNQFKYGWKDIHGNFNMNSLKDFRTTYVTMSLEEIFTNKIGTCIEQSFFQKSMLDKMGFETKLFVIRSYTVLEENSETVKMHCFSLFKDGNKWYHFEHSNPEMVGIHEYNTIEEALENLIAYFKKRDNGVSRKLDEIEKIPANYSFTELLDYIDNKERKLGK